MKYFKLLFVICGLCCAMAAPVMAQTVEVEKVHEISRRAKRGYLAKMDFDEAKGQYTLYFVVSENKRRIKLEVYTFDRDFNLVEQHEEEEMVEQLSKKYKWFKYVSPEKEVIIWENVTVESNFVGTLVLKKKQITRKWSWYYGGYSTDVKLLEKIKPRSEGGDKYYYKAHYEDEKTGNLIVVASTKNKDANKNFEVLKFNRSGELLERTNLGFKFAMMPIFTRRITQPDPDDAESTISVGAFMIFAPIKEAKENTNPDPTAYEIVRIDNDLKVEKAPFKAETAYWRVDEALEDGKGNYYFYGVAVEDDRYYNFIPTPRKFKSVQLLKFNNIANKVEYVTATNIKEMLTKAVNPPSQRREPEYTGGPFSVKGSFVNEEGEFFLYGQNYKADSKGAITYKDVIGLYFDPKGALRAMYGIDPVENNRNAKSLGAPQYLLPAGLSGKYMYWMLTEIDGFDLGENRLELYPRIARISKADGSITDFLTLGVVDKKKYYLDSKYPYFKLGDGRLVFFGSSSNGKRLYFSRVRFD
ncbi:hypothetical protein SAMN05421780_108166 [Flexibacter flexilis DSM 6793]|uniref:Uncharacterized protein n=1 Tax=Flexibacter flexilis DSM 6793 TaxID=927664 RepID=A0A1I1LCF7_9BACT|nr:hypothetical protein [Flexibacter flexilis]SFC70719.1 hypothetical protein SAMN05421780_108166 [Flexibacter flexilis DSM 6793]